MGDEGWAEAVSLASVAGTAKAAHCVTLASTKSVLRTFCGKRRLTKAMLVWG